MTRNAVICFLILTPYPLSNLLLASQPIGSDFPKIFSKNNIFQYGWCEKLEFLSVVARNTHTKVDSVSIGVPDKWDPGPGTWNLEPVKWDPGPGIP